MEPIGPEFLNALYNILVAEQSFYGRRDFSFKLTNKWQGAVFICDLSDCEAGTQGTTTDASTTTEAATTTETTTTVTTVRSKNKV